MQLHRTSAASIAAVAAVTIGIISSGAAGASAPTAKASATTSAGTVRNNWPCANCSVSIPTTYKPTLHTALLVALHGDEGVNTYIFSTWRPVTDKANVILFAPQCPTNEGCRFPNGNGGYTNSWWGWLQYSATYDDGWIARQVRTIAASYNLDPKREYLTGWSGGADYLGWYALAHASQFAAANFVVGGVPYYQSCPSTRMAAYFLMGSNDFRYQSGQPTQVQQILKSCGDPTAMVVIPGANHNGTVADLTSMAYAQSILTWMLNHHR